MRILHMELTPEEKKLWDAYLAGIRCEERAACCGCPFNGYEGTEDTLCKLVQRVEMIDEIKVSVPAIEFEDGMDVSNLYLKDTPNTTILGVYEDPLEYKWYVTYRFDHGRVHSTSFSIQELKNRIERR